MADNPYDVSNVQTTFDDAGHPVYTLNGHSITGVGRLSTPFKDMSSQNMVDDSEQSEIQKLASDLGMYLNSDTIDYLTEYYLNEKGSQNAYQRELAADNTKYQRAVEDLKKAGISPFLAFDSIRGGSVSSSGSSVSGGYYTSRKNAKTQQQTSMTASAVAVLGLIASAMIRLFK